MFYVNEEVKKLERISYKGSRKGYLRLDMNENPDGIPSQILEEVKGQITSEDISMYPEQAKVINLISKKLNIEEDQICLTNGSDDAIRLIVQVFGRSGSDLVTVNPTFEMYKVYSAMYGVNIKNINYDESFNINIEEYINAINKNTSLVLLLNPNSPIGKRWSLEEVELILKKANSVGAMVIIDEAYKYFIDDTDELMDNVLLNLINTYKNVLVIRTFSKAYSIAGTRIGYVLSNKEVVKYIKNASSTYTVNVLALKLAEYMLSNSKIAEKMIEAEKLGRDYLISYLKANEYVYYYNSGNYILIKTKKNSKEVSKELEERKVLVKTYGLDLLSNWIRVTTGSIESMKKFLVEFEKIDKVL